MERSAQPRIVAAFPDRPRTRCHAARPDSGRLLPARAGSAAAVLLLALTGCGSDNDGAPSTERGQVIEKADIATFTQAQIDQLSSAAGLTALAGPARCDVRLQRLKYATAGARGESGATATAALLVPSGADCPGPYRLVSHTHGTWTVKALTQASTSAPETQLLTAMLAARGFAVVATDYLGFGGSDYAYHPFLHAASEASAAVDSLRAARQALTTDGKATYTGVLLTGYSQGGHASMATQKTIEELHAAEFTIAAAGHMSGPYNLAGSIETAIALLPGGTGGSTVFVPFALTSYQKVYGGLYDDASRYIKAPYATGIDSLLPGTLTSSELVAQGRLPQQLGDLVSGQFISDLQTATTPLRQRLDENTLLGWAPRSPTLLCGGRRDPVVPLKNATDAQAAFAGRGTTVNVIDVESVPAFASLFPATLTPQQLADYHGTTVPPLCLNLIRDQLFEPFRATAAQP